MIDRIKDIDEASEQVGKYLAQGKVEHMWNIDTRYVAQTAKARGDAWVYGIKCGDRDWGIFVDRDLRHRTLFEARSEAHAELDEVIVQLKGTYWVKIASWTRTLLPGEAALIPAATEHSAGIASNLVGTHFLVLTFPRENGVLRDAEPGGIMLPSGSAAWLAACFRMLRDGATATRLLPLTVLPEFLRACATAERLPSSQTQPDSIVGELLPLLEQPQTPTLQELSRAAALSPAHLQRRFSAVIGHSPLQYANAWKLDRIAERLRAGSTLPLVELTAEFGFNDQKHFRTLFLRRFAQTPSAYRKNPPPRETPGS
jgi:AraC-like DNA-binding protein